MRWLRQHQASPMPLLLGVQTEVWRRERNRRQTSINLLSCYFLRQENFALVIFSESCTFKCVNKHFIVYKKSIKTFVVGTIL
jgi:hypothetical protein